MPIYEYECESCGVRFERIQSMQAEPVRQCPECSGVVHKVIHASGIIFKGSGWYITDSKKSTSSAVTSETKTESTASKTDKSSDAPTKSEAKTDTKTETKAEAKPAKTTESK